MNRRNPFPFKPTASIRPVGLIAVLAVTLFYSITAAAQITVTNTDDSGTGSFRWAVDQVNSGNGSTIDFAIPGPGPHVIQPLTQYVSFLEPVTVDGTSQPGYAPGSPEIVLDGSQGGDISGLVFTGNAGNSTVMGLSIINFERIGILFIGGSNTVSGNLIGIDPAGIAAGNDTGISVLSTNNVIGGTDPEDRNVISGNNIGVDLTPGSGLNEIIGNFIGTSLDGQSAVGNKFNVQIRGSSDNQVGGTTAAERNVIAGAFFDGPNSGGSGVVITRGFTQSGAVNPTGNQVQGNYIGTDVTGTVALANERAGVLLLFGANDNLVGGTGAGEGNLISGNGLYGVYLQGSVDAPVTSNRIEGNRIGTDFEGSSALPNDVGVWNQGNSDANVIGSADGGNLISGNRVGAILILEGEENSIQGNLIGTDTTGLLVLANGSGVEVRDDSNTVGGNGLNEGNVISGNGRFGIHLNDADDNQVSGNIIGADSAGTASLAGQEDGILITGGGDHLVQNNVIAGNTGNGVSVVNDADGNRITANAMSDNGGIGIDLGDDGMTENDPGDPDLGPNKLQNFPEISSTEFNESSNELTIVYSVPSDPSASAYPLQIEFFVATADAQGGALAGTDSFGVTDVGQSKKITIVAPAVSVGDQITGTATDSDGNTSEYGRGAGVTRASLFKDGFETGGN